MSNTVADAWGHYARRLAAWAIRYLVNRDDVWGGYRPTRTRGTPYLDSTGTPILGKNGKPKLRGAAYTANTGAHHNPNKHIGLDDLTRHFADSATATYAVYSPPVKMVPAYGG